ncbi:alpha/beta hydrolase [Psychrobacillus sp. MER TA 171]|uniref:alpha/beta fold hydrolase n=1 Tax=Psychrobacillus sp. MER TA 171 TaxID=2939577 RepID=UPI0020410427|nr:alpha/beta hydrolase [Psychrobacillus sp. MER TA 171]MCM3358342.1 alpha/beta hydrolase [Psychrobacillus sp. MER TA 171]
MALYYKEDGEQNEQIILFLHGGGVGGWMWDEQVQYFKGKYHCIVPDLPGHGREGTEKVPLKRLDVEYECRFCSSSTIF